MENEKNPIQPENTPVDNPPKLSRKGKEASAPVYEYNPEGEESAPARLARLDFEKQEAQRAAGQEESTYGLWGWLWRIWHKFVPERVPVRVNKKKYCLLALFLGFCGVHRFYSKSYRLGVFYALLFWSGFPFIMAVLDLWYAAFLPADEDGCIEV